MKHYFKPSEEDKDFCEVCGRNFRDTDRHISTPPISPSTEVKGQQGVDDFKKLLDKHGFDFYAFEYENEFSAKAILNAMKEVASQPQEVGQDELWDAVVARIAAADLMAKVTPGDNEAVVKWKKKAIDILSKQFTLIKK